MAPGFLVPWALGPTPMQRARLGDGVSRDVWRLKLQINGVSNCIAELAVCSGYLRQNLHRHGDWHVRLSRQTGKFMDTWRSADQSARPHYKKGVFLAFHRGLCQRMRRI